MVDVSACGARIEVDPPLTRGEWVTVELPSTADELRNLFQFPISPADAERLGLPTGRVRGKIRAGAEQLADGRYAHGVVFQKGFWGDLRYRVHRAMPMVALLLFLALLFPAAQLEDSSVFSFLAHPFLDSYALAVALFLISQLALAGAYRPPRDGGGYTPSVTCIVACKDDEVSIRRTLQCIFRSDYPKDELHVIAVDDGSADDTLRELRSTARDFPALEIVSFEGNVGKRRAMAEGARLATGEVVIYVDCGTFLRRDSIRKMIAPLADARVGAVAGHATVHNAQANALTRMQEVRYHLAFRVGKAAQSVFGCVTSCGCFAAYRRSAVMEVLPSWTRQTSAGGAANVGDERALTRLVLERHRVVYHSGAICSTVVPDRWRAFLRQQLRWWKSWVRESASCSSVLWRGHPGAALWFCIGALLQLAAPFIVLGALLPPLFGLGASGFVHVYAYGAMLLATLYALVYLARSRIPR